MEHFRSVVILCTNLVKEIDPGLNSKFWNELIYVAFFRRMKFVVEFKVPEAADRALLWR